MHLLNRMNWIALVLASYLLSGCSSDPRVIKLQDVSALQGSGKGVVYFSSSIQLRGELFTNNEASQPTLVLALDPPLTVMENGVATVKRFFSAPGDGRSFTLPAGRYGLSSIRSVAGGPLGTSYNLGQISGRWILSFDIKDGEVLYLGHWHFDPRRQDAQNIRLYIRVDDKFDEIADELRQNLNGLEPGRGDKLTPRLVVPSQTSIPLTSAPEAQPNLN